MSYYNSAEGQKISRARAIREVEAHCCEVELFLAEMGDCAFYDAQAVLRWLGY